MQLASKELTPRSNMYLSIPMLHKVNNRYFEYEYIVTNCRLIWTLNPIKALSVYWKTQQLYFCLYSHHGDKKIHLVMFHNF
jgi:hypothetical protein